MQTYRSCETNTNNNQRSNAILSSDSGSQRRRRRSGKNEGKWISNEHETWHGMCSSQIGSIISKTIRHSICAAILRLLFHPLPKTMKINSQFIIFNLNFLTLFALSVSLFSGGSRCRHTRQTQTIYFAAKCSRQNEKPFRDSVQFSVMNSRDIIIAH